MDLIEKRNARLSLAYRIASAAAYDLSEDTGNLWADLELHEALACAGFDNLDEDHIAYLRRELGMDADGYPVNDEGDRIEGSDRFRVPVSQRIEGPVRTADESFEAIWWRSRKDAA